MQSIHANGIDIRFRVLGSGPWVTLSHSLACGYEMWDREVEQLAKRFTVLAYDSRGHGGTSAPPGPYNLGMIADDVKAMYDALGIRKSHWIGLSMGGVFGLATAIKYPDLFESMVLADTMEPMVEPTLKRWFKDSFRAKEPELMKRVSGWIRATPVEGYLGISAAIPTIDVTHRLGEIGMPCLALVGADDVAMPVPFSETLAKHLPDAELVVIPDAGHLSNLEQPEAFNAALRNFYDKIGKR
jgi:3-oxoadipate enol-lactonase